MKAFLPTFSTSHADKWHDQSLFDSHATQNCSARHNLGNFESMDCTPVGECQNCSAEVSAIMSTTLKQSTT